MAAFSIVGQLAVTQVAAVGIEPTVDWFTASPGTLPLLLPRSPRCYWGASEGFSFYAAILPSRRSLTNWIMVGDVSNHSRPLTGWSMHLPWSLYSSQGHSCVNYKAPQLDKLGRFWAQKKGHPIGLP